MKHGQDVRVCIIGAGPSGITAAKNVLQAGIKNLVVYDKNDRVGGNWIYTEDESHSSVYETTHIISSKKLSQFADFPMPDEYPDYPSQAQLLSYFQSYAEHFHILDYIQFNTTVVNIEKIPGECWRVTLADGSSAEFDHLLIASGHHHDPRIPDYPGKFAGEFLHSHSFKHNRPFQDKRVLVIGGGNSACDVAVETGRISDMTAISWRRGYHIVPKFIFGQPPDVVNERFLWMPMWLRELSHTASWWLVTGGNAKYGLQTPEHSILSSHPTVNSEMLYFIRHGRIQPRPEIARFEGQMVHFVDGTSDEFDTIIAATGYKITTPFFDDEFLDFSDGDVPLYLRVFHPEHPTLHFIGLVQPQGCIWPLADAQSELVAKYIIGEYDHPADMQQRIADDVAEIKRTFRDAARHTVEVEYHSYLDSLKQAIHPEHKPGAQKQREHLVIAAAGIMGVLLLFRRLARSR